MITDDTYHEKGKYFIPNTKSNSPRPSDENSETSLKYFISICERVFCLNFLGVELYNELIVALEDIDAVENKKWFDLVNGVDYVKDDVTYRFEGLRGYNKSSMISAFVFCEYLQDADGYFSTTGVVKLNKENGLDYTPKFMAAYFDFIGKYQNSNSSEPLKIETRYGYVLDYTDTDKKNALVTLETYMEDHKDLFEGYVFHTYNDTLNSFNI